MNIQEKIDDLKSLYTFSKEQHPYLSGVFYTISDIPLEELKSYASENNLKYEMSKYEQRFRTCVHVDGGMISLTSRKVVAINPVETVYKEVFDEQYKNQAIEIVKQQAVSMRH